jgi:hypothetical protein
MARTRGSEYAGAFYHVICPNRHQARGNISDKPTRNLQTCFQSRPIRFFKFARDRRRYFLWDVRILSRAAGGIPAALSVSRLRLRADEQSRPSAAGDSTHPLGKRQRNRPPAPPRSLDHQPLYAADAADRDCNKELLMAKQLEQ